MSLFDLRWKHPRLGRFNLFPRKPKPGSVRDYSSRWEQMRVAYLVCGHLRKFENLKASWAAFRAKLPDADVFVHTWDDHGKRDVKGGQWISGSDADADAAGGVIEEARAAMAPVEMVVENLKDHLSRPENSLKRKGRDLYYANEPALKDITADFTANVMTQLYSISRCFGMADSHAAENGFKYDVIVRSRGDRAPLISKFCDRIDLCRRELTDGVLFFNMHGHQHPGGGGGCLACDLEKGKLRTHVSHTNDLCDVHYYGSHESMRAACNLYSAVPRLMEGFDEHNKAMIAADVGGAASHVAYEPGCGIHRIKSTGVMENVLKGFYPERLLREHLQAFSVYSDADNVAIKPKKKAARDAAAARVRKTLQQ